MRALCLTLMLIAGPSLAWEARVENGLCILDHTGAGATVTVTYDPTGPLYTIALSRMGPWVPGPAFAMQFDGGRPLTISTDRHRLDQDGRRLQVSDTGFGNVLDGLEFNSRAIAALGEDQITLALDGAAPAVQAFRNCTAIPVA